MINIFTNLFSSIKSFFKKTKNFFFSPVRYFFKNEKKIFIDDFVNEIIRKNIRCFYDKKIKFLEIVLKIILDQNFTNDPNFFFLS